MNSREAYAKRAQVAVWLREGDMCNQGLKLAEIAKVFKCTKWEASCLVARGYRNRRERIAAHKKPPAGFFAMFDALAGHADLHHKKPRRAKNDSRKRV